ncbi:hypothetical protein LCGC14_2139330 [marine sediment metagenome]|uniref:Uncharacterized protein n=1 Tax=marine sediment metagenome TaxID=412755 RepID=A0A0F9DYT7_9ZZZZ
MNGQPTLLDIKYKLLYKLTAYGEPVAQGRHRSRIVNMGPKKQYIQNYELKENTDYKKFIQNQVCISGIPENGLFDEPLVLSCRIYRMRPKSKPKKIIYPTTTPDLDNYLKAIKDALTGLVYRDDSLIVGYRDVWKLYDSNRPRVEIELYGIEQ